MNLSLDGSQGIGCVMTTVKWTALVGMLLMILTPPLSAETGTDSARELVRSALEHWRGTTSYSEMTMTIHHSDWRRSLSMRAWTQGDKLSLVRVTGPAKDKGNGTLLKSNEMWTFSPKVNRIIKVPSSMMNQSWMGSDFSNKDIARSSDIVDQYEHRLLRTETAGNHRAYWIESIPHEDAAIVWGKEVLKIRDDFVMLEHQFWDQDGILVKAMTTLSIETLGGREVAARQRMQKADEPEEWTEIILHRARFDAPMDDYLFTLSNLRNPRESP